MNQHTKVQLSMDSSAVANANGARSLNAFHNALREGDFAAAEQHRIDAFAHWEAYMDHQAAAWKLIHNA